MVFIVLNLTSDYNPLHEPKGIEDIVSMMDNIAPHNPSQDEGIEIFFLY